jgi:hypothetical protein
LDFFLGVSCAETGRLLAGGAEARKKSKATLHVALQNTSDNA